VRRRPGVIFGSDGLEGCEHAIFEILSNAIDEAREGYGREIVVTRFADHSVEVEDFGRGCPVDWNEREGCYAWEQVFCELYAGGKYNNDEGESYEFSLGLNGLGACATQYASEYMDVVIYRDGKRFTLRFERGENVGGLSSEPYSGRRTGTIIRWKPDLGVFTDIAVSLDYYNDTLKRQSVVNPGLSFRLRNQRGDGGFDESVFVYEHGIEDYVAELAGDDALTKPTAIESERRGRDRADKPEYKVKLAACFGFSNRVSLVEYYHNSSWLEHGGSPEKAAKSAFVSSFDRYLKAQNKYTKNESKITWNDIADCLILVTNCFSTQTSYENQTKKAITNKFIQEATTEFLREKLDVWFIENPTEGGRAADQVLINKRSREQAEKTRLNLKKTLTSNLDISNRVEKFVDCRTKDVTQREIYIVEGDSALGACKLSRDPNFQGIMPVRGKILNCLKVDYARIFKSEIITDLIRVLGCGVELAGKHAKDITAFDLGNLRWARVIICTDADEDGFHIRTLMLAMLYRLVPTLIQEGLVYIAESPLFEITCKDKTYFAYSEREKAEITQTLGDAKYTLQRSKGLGENDPAMMWLTTMNPETRRLIRVMPEDAERTSDVFTLLLGDNLAGRREHIAEHGHEWMDMADVS
jgi:DNA gyrase subunit B